MKIEANDFGRWGVAFVFATESSEAAIYEKAIYEKAICEKAICEKTKGDGLNLRPND
jgi:hypothetical protein